MKQIIILIAMICLGVFIGQLVSGDDDNSIKSSLSNLWQAEIESQNTYP